MAFGSTNQAISTAQRMLDVLQNDVQMAKLITEGDPRTFALDTYNRQNIVRTALVTNTWKSIGRQVLAMHPEVVDEVKVATSDKIPGEVLRVLPYMNPLVVFSEPPVFDSWQPAGRPHRVTGLVEEKMRLLGFLTYGTREVPVQDGDGMRVEQKIYATSDVDANRFGIMAIFETLDASGKSQDFEINNMTIFFQQNLTLAETVEAMLERFHWDADMGEKELARCRKWMRRVVSTIVGTLFYLCSTTLEAEKVPAKATKNLGRSISRKPLSLFRIGWTTGAALTRYRQSRTNSTSEMGDLSHQQDPQHRRSHFKMQPCGTGKKERKLIFVSAYWTHRERLGEEGVNVARAVPRVDGKGSARESTRVSLDVDKAIKKLEEV